MDMNSLWFTVMRSIDFLQFLQIPLIARNYFFIDGRLFPQYFHGKFWSSSNFGLPPYAPWTLWPFFILGLPLSGLLFTNVSHLWCSFFISSAYICISINLISFLAKVSYVYYCLEQLGQCECLILASFHQCSQHSTYASMVSGSVGSWSHLLKAYRS